jgi:SecD/SecF fusion protein
MKSLFLFFLLFFAWTGCAPDLKKDGGVRIVLEANVNKALRDCIRPDDSISFFMLKETTDEYLRQQKPFVELYFDKLEQAFPDDVAAAHFITGDLKPSASLKECKLFFDKKIAAGMETIHSNLKKRMYEFGIEKASILKGDRPEQLIVELPGKNDIRRIEALLQSTAKLEFWETYENREVFPLLSELNKQLKDEMYPELTDSTPLEKKEIPTGNSLKDQLEYEKRKNEPERERAIKMNPLFAALMPAIQYDANGNPVDYRPGPAVGYANLKDTSTVSTYLSGNRAKKIFGPLTKFLWCTTPMKDSIFTLVAIKKGMGGKAPVSGNFITDARKQFRSEGRDHPQISLTMTKESSWDWKKMTHDNIGKSIAIVLDDHVYSYPTVQGEISSGVSSITGNFTVEEADDLINVLKAGCLPMEVKIVKEEKVLPGGK